MFDGIDAGCKSDTHAFGALHVRHDGYAELVGGLAGRLGDLWRHAHHTGLAGLRRVEDASGDKELDHVYAALGERLHHGSGLLRGVGHLREEPCTVSSGHGDAGAG